MAINFPPPTTIGEIYTDPASSRTWKWNGKAWEGTASNAFLMDNMTEGTTTKILTDSERALIGSAIQTETNGTVQGTGATTLNIVAADEGTVAGDARGENSVDLQTTRSASTMVASGAKSALIGGIDNTATNQNCVCLGGARNTVGGIGAVALGGADSNAANGFTLVSGLFATANNNGARVFADNSANPITSRQANEFTIQASALRLEDDKEAVGKVLICNNADGSGNWAYIDGVGDSVTGTATFTNSTNTIALTGVGLLEGLAVGDVIEVTGSTSGNNDKAFTVTNIVSPGSVEVNDAHANKTWLPANKTLQEQPNVSGVTVTLACKAKNAPLGYGQGWVDVVSDRLASTNYNNFTGRTIAVAIRGIASAQYGTLDILFDGRTIDNNVASVNLEVISVQAVIPTTPTLVYYRLNPTNIGSFSTWHELR